MERAEENRGQLNSSLSMNCYSRYLLHEFMTQNRVPKENEQQEGMDEEIQLSLGLSMNGKFGVDPTRKKLKRVSSISNLYLTVGGIINNEISHQARKVAFDSHAPLARTCSLPTQKEARRHAKTSQLTRSMEARKIRMEKLKNLRLVKDKEDGNNGNVENGNYSVQMISDSHSQQIAGAIQIAEVKSPSSTNSLPQQGEQKLAIRPAERNAKGATMLLKHSILHMPLVSTKGDGCNGNKIDGFLYRFKKGQEVGIVCVCHGMFLSPQEFIKHGGGGEVEHPLKHIVVNSSPLF